MERSPRWGWKYQAVGALLAALALGGDLSAQYPGYPYQVPPYYQPGMALVPQPGFGQPVPPRGPQPSGPQPGRLQPGGPQPWGTPLQVRNSGPDQEAPPAEPYLVTAKPAKTIQQTQAYLPEPTVQPPAQVVPPPVRAVACATGPACGPPAEPYLVDPTPPDPPPPGLASKVGEWIDRRGELKDAVFRRRMLADRDPRYDPQALNLYWLWQQFLFQDRSQDCVWGSSEYLLWKVRHGPIPVPLFTTSADPAATGALNDPTASVAVGAGSSNDAFRYSYLAGDRTTVGFWLDKNQHFGFEGNGFFLARRSTGYNLSTAGDTVIAVPFNDTSAGLPGFENSIINPGFPFTAQATSTLKMWGSEVNAIANWVDGYNCHLRWLLGARYLDMQENLGLGITTIDTVTNGAQIYSDKFRTRNQFLGGQVGLQTGFAYGRLALECTAKVAMGTTHQVIDVNGSVVVTNDAFGVTSGTYPGGIFAQASNSGRFTRNTFTVIPEAQLKVIFALTNHVRVFAGYDFLYDTSVVRPGNQIDRNLNLFQSPFFTFFLAGPFPPASQPAPPTFKATDFWAQGYSLGLEFLF